MGDGRLHQGHRLLTHLVTSIEDVAQEQGFSALMSSSYFDLNRELELVGAFHRCRVTRIAHIANQRCYRSNLDCLQALGRYWLQRDFLLPDGGKSFVSACLSLA